MPGASLGEKVMGVYGRLYLIKSAILHLCQTEEHHVNVTGLVLVKRHGLCPLVPQPPPDCRSVTKLLTFSTTSSPANNCPRMQCVTE